MKKSCFLFLLFIITMCSYAQEIPLEIDEPLSEEDEIIDNLLGDESVEEFLKSATTFQFLHFSVNYNNKTYFSGRDIGTDQFNVNPQITYIHSNGFFAGITGVYYSEFTPKWNYTSASAGYGKSFGKDKTYNWSASYTKYFFSDASEENSFTNAITFDLGIKNKKSTLGTEIATTYLFGEENSLQMVSTTYGVLNIYKTKKHHLKLRPQLNIIVGQQTFQLSQAFPTRPPGPPGAPPPPPLRDLGNTGFGLINTQFQIPLQYNIGSFDFELGYIINFPTALEGETNLETTSNFNFSISYLLDL